MLPPLPPLQRAPNLESKISATNLVVRASDSSDEQIYKPVTNKTPVLLTEREINYEESRECEQSNVLNEGVSQLVLKNATKGTAKKRALIHSIPKFSQVLPNQQLSEAQRILQERLLKKRKGDFKQVIPII